ncbi:hypothetical protein AB6A40_007132 [Gnathostoma spinigerum]|uniref:t-SNARE coiled-coil homology domain-containing protein n=1 Tax=Gnathostoma spinigerum TaxID=75299 RepID=A0ABD6EKB6_9BILA
MIHIEQLNGNQKQTVMKDRLTELQTRSESGTTLADLYDRLSYARHSDASEHEELLSSEHWNSIESFLSRVNSVIAVLDQMETLLNQIRARHSQLLIEPGVHPQFTEDLNRCTESFNQLSKTTAVTIKKMNEETRTDLDVNRKRSDGSVDSRIKRNQVMAVTRRLQNILLAFNNEQLTYKEKCKQKIKSYLTVSGRELPEEDVDKAIESGQLFDYTKGLILARRDKKSLYDEVKLRHEDILRLEESIRELHEMFQDMSMLIESQGELMNHIEKNVDTAVDFVSNAHRNVRRARQMQASTRKKKIIVVVLLIILVFILMVIFSFMFCFYFPFLCR